MEAHIGQHPSSRGHETRKQPYLQFALQSGDELLGKLPENQAALLQSEGTYKGQSSLDFRSVPYAAVSIAPARG